MDKLAGWVVRNSVAPADLQALIWDNTLKLWKPGAPTPATHTHTAATVVKRKAANETVNNTATLQNDDDLLFTIAANEVWFVTLFLQVDHGASAGPGFRYAWSLPSGASGLFTGVKHAGAASLVEPLGPTTPISADTQATATQLNNAFILHVLLVNGANAGTAQFQWAQYIATAENTTVRANSALVAVKQ